MDPRRICLIRWLRASNGSSFIIIQGGHNVGEKTLSFPGFFQSHKLTFP